MKTLAILGASGHGKVIADIAAQIDEWHEIVFFDDAKPVGYIVSGVWHVLGNADAMAKRLSDFDGVIVGIGDNRARLRLSVDLQKLGAELVSVIHPRACVSDLASVAPGSVVMAGAVLSSDARVGLAGILNTASTVDHDCLLGDGVHVSPGANLAGNITVGNCSWLGIGCSVREQVFIGCDVVVGAGAVVVGNVSDSVTVMGCPARISEG